MPKGRHTNIVDGYTVFQAARRASHGEDEASATGKPPADDGTVAPKIGLHIGHTVLPTRHDIACYECGYAFQLTGRAESTFCPKCRKEVKLKDCLIEGESTDNVKTGSTVHVAEGAVVRGGVITAGNLVLDGVVDGGRLRVMQWLELGPSARFDPAAAEAAHLRVRQGARIHLEEVRFCDVEVSGCLQARVVARGLIRVKAGGVIEGDVNGPRLEVEEGGGLKGSLCIRGAHDTASDDA